MTIILPVNNKYLKYNSLPDADSWPEIVIMPEIDEFVTSADRFGHTELITHNWPWVFAVSFEDERDAALFKLTYA